MAARIGRSRGQSAVDMTKGNPYAIMIRFALPILLSQVFQQMYNTADTLIVGRFLGTDALAAVSASGNPIFLIYYLTSDWVHGFEKR